MRYMLGSTVLGLSLALVTPAFAADPQPSPNYLIQVNGAGDLSSQVAAAGGTLLWSHPDLGYAAATSTDPGFAGKLKQAGVQQVDQDLVTQWVPTAEQAALQQVGTAAAQTTASPAGSFFYACQWALPKIDAPAAWAKGDLGSGIKVAVLDTGTDPFHSDLAGKVDTANSTSLLTPGSSSCGSFDEGTIYDLNFHGSFVSGLITTNNLGSTGVAPAQRQRQLLGHHQRYLLRREPRGRADHQHEHRRRVRQEPEGRRTAGGGPQQGGQLRELPGQAGRRRRGQQRRGHGQGRQRHLGAGPVRERRVRLRHRQP
jgi:Subtilase family